MKMLHCASMLLLACSQQVGAQDVTVTYTVKWDNELIVGGGTNTGAIYATISPGIGETVKWTTPPGKGQPGVIKAFASSIFDLLNTLNGNEGTLTWTVPASLNLANLPGTPDGNGGIAGVNVAQVRGLNPNPNVDNPIKIFDLQWQDTGEMFNGFVEYTTKVSSSKIFLDIGTVGNEIWVGHNATFILNGSGSFGVSIPTPAGMSMLGLAGLVAMRRRR
jgi:MYXO-CTERM domain-containing protein